MTEKNTKARRHIQRAGSVFDVNYDDKTYRNIKKILECHRECIFGPDFFDFSLAGKVPISDMIPYLYRSFISRDEISEVTVNKMVMQILNDEKTADILYETLEQIKTFSAEEKRKSSASSGEGPLYYNILKRLYFTEAYPVETDIYIDLNISPNQYSYRKEEATMLFGIYFWSRCLSFWETRKEDIGRIQLEEGRDDLRLKGFEAV